MWILSLRKLTGFSVDVFCSEAEHTTIAYELYKKINIRFSEANYNVRKWTSNDKTLMKLINRDELISNKINTKDSSKENLKYWELFGKLLRTILI